MPRYFANAVSCSWNILKGKYGLRGKPHSALSRKFVIFRHCERHTKVLVIKAMCLKRGRKDKHRCVLIMKNDYRNKRLFEYEKRICCQMK